MFVYNLLIILVFVGFLFRKKMKPKHINAFFLLICVIIVAVIAFRGDTMGGDTHTYRYFFNNPGQDTGFKEPGLIIINKIIRVFTTNVYVASVIKAILCLWPMLFFIKKLADDKFTALFLFLTFSIEGSTFLLEFSAERQCFSMAFFCLFAYSYAKNHYRYNLSCLVYLILMVFTHYSSLLVVLLLLLEFVKIKKIPSLIICIIASLSLYYIGDLFAPILQFADVIEKEAYVSNLENVQDNSIIALLPFVGSFVVSLIALPEEKINTIWFKSYFLAVIFSAFMLPIGINISRMCAFFYIGTFISLPWTFEYIKNPILRYSFIGIIYGYFTYRFYQVLEIMTQVENGMVPYKTFFN